MSAKGLSPRVRGKRSILRVIPAGGRSIPACAGETRGGEIQRPAGAVYPRVCGGNQFIATRLRSRQGLSPRVRGKHQMSGRGFCMGRSIPACAGETSSGFQMLVLGVVYPRVCGGNNSGTSAILPPYGSIPACAGETRMNAANCSARKVYPRVCGGNVQFGPETAGERGLSPRVRGKRLAVGATQPIARSIPACAGETTTADHSTQQKGVYPRVCGGNRHWAPLA